MLPIRIEMFGGLVIVDGFRTITRFRTKKAGALLAHLAFHLGRSFPREELIELLWPDTDLDKGRMSLRTELAALRRQLEPPGIPTGSVIEADANFVRLKPGAVNTDVSEYRDALQAGANAADDSERIGPLSTAAALYTGELLSGYYDDWIVPEREHITATYLAALRKLTRLHAALRNTSLALEFAHRAVRADEFSEEAHRDLIRLYLAVGDTEAAAGQLARLLVILRDELARPPSEATRQLQEEVAQRAGTVRPPKQAPASLAAKHVSKEPRSEEAFVGGKPRLYRLPARFTRFFGRIEELERLVRQLTPEGAEASSSQNTRLVTLSGPGGTGKTRLALEAAERLAPAYDNAVWFIPLEEIRDPELIPGAIADTLCINTLCIKRSPSVQVIDQVADVLWGRPTLLVLDNYEQLAVSGSSVVSALLTRAPDLRCLVTSRVRLALPGEREVPLSPLPVPAGQTLPEELLEVPSVQLYVDRAQSVRPDFQITKGNAEAVATLCERLEGVPLAIELAAARAQVLTPAQMADMIGERFALLSTRRTDKVSRHRSLWATIDWSYALLSPELQRFFTQLSVFRGGWTLEAVQSTAAEPRALEYLTQLRGHSMVIAEERGTEFRFSLFDSLRDYADTRLSDEERREAQGRHGAYYWALAERLQMDAPSGGQRAALERLEQDHDNFRAALHRALECDPALATRLAGSLWSFWQAHGHYAEGRAALAKVLAHPANQDVREPAEVEALAHAVNAAGSLAWNQGDYEEGRACHERALALFRSIDHARGTAYALIWLGNDAYHSGDYHTARRHYDESLGLMRALEDENGIGYGLVWLGNVESRLEHYEEAAGFYEECLALARSGNDRQLTSYCLYGLGYGAYKQGRLDDAEGFHRECLLVRQELGDKLGVATSLESFAFLAHAQGRHDRAVELAAAAETLREEIGAPVPPIMRKEYDTMLAASKGSLSPSLHAELEARSRSLGLDGAIALALNA
jgi:predicted ATPase/DNA-binding SARP family transcriptional activator